MTELILSSGTVDLYDNIPISLTYSIADIREPEKRQGTYSKTIKVPSTKNNDQLFSHLFEIDITDTSFNPNLKTDAKILVDGLLQAIGSIRLRDITVNDQDKIEYQLIFLGENVNLFQDIDESLLTDLDLSSFDHVYNSSNIETSWSATIGTGYVYPMIDYGFNQLDNWLPSQFKPAIYVKEYVDAIFDAQGFSYDSTFFNTTFFKRLIIPFQGGEWSLDETTISNRKFRAASSALQTITPLRLGIGTTTARLEIDDDSTSPNFDNNSNYNTTLFEFVADAGGRQDFIFTGTLKGQYSTNPSPQGVASLNATIRIIRERNNVGVVMNTGFVSIAIPASTGIFGDEDISVIVDDMDLQISDKVYVEVETYYVHDLSPNFSDLELRIEGGAYLLNQVDNIGWQIGDTISINSAIPKEIKQKDFLTSLIKMFNLYVVPNRLNEKELIIEPRDDYYSGTLLDWTDKWAMDKDMLIQPMGKLNEKTYLFRYKEGKDYLNEDYQTTIGETYGHRKLEINNDFVKGEKKIEPIFEPTPSAGTLLSNRVLPSIFKIDQNGNKTSVEGGIRILYYGGLKTSNPQWRYGVNFKSTYPYAGHLDDIESPTKDLNFGAPNKIYYGVNPYLLSLSYTNSNLYHDYWRKYLEEITDKDSKVVTVYLNLTPLDILNLDFAKTYIINGHHLRLNKIMDYDAVNSKLTKCEFIKIKESTVPSGVVVEMTGGFNTALGNEFNPHYNTPEPLGNNLTP